MKIEIDTKNKTIRTIGVAIIVIILALFFVNSITAARTKLMAGNTQPPTPASQIGSSSDTIFPIVVLILVGGLLLAFSSKKPQRSLEEESEYRKEVARLDARKDFQNRNRRW